MELTQFISLILDLRMQGAVLQSTLSGYHQTPLYKKVPAPLKHCAAHLASFHLPRFICFQQKYNQITFAVINLFCATKLHFPVFFSGLSWMTDKAPMWNCPTKD